MNNILVLTYWSFEDALIQTYTLPYLKIMMDQAQVERIHLLCVEQDLYRNSESQMAIDKLKSEGIHVIQRPYKPFGMSALFSWLGTLILLSKLIIVRNIRCIHSWCTPPGVFAYVLSVLWRRDLVIDSYEPHAEAMVENGAWQKDSKAFKILFYFERIMSSRAKHIIAATEGMRGYAREKYGIELTDFHVKPACVNVAQFDYKNPPSDELKAELDIDGKVCMVYAGKFGGIYLEDEFFDFVRVAHEFFGKDKFKVILLSNILFSDLEQYCKRFKIDPQVFELRFVPHQEVQGYMALADFAICPVKPIPTKRYCTPIKDGEYWAMGLPVVIPQGISDDSQIILENDIGAVLNAFSVEEYKKACKKIEHLMHKEDTSQRIREVAIKHRDFGVAKKVYEEVYG